MVEKSFLIMLAFAASLLVFLAAPRFFSSTETLYSDIVIQQLSTGELPSESVYIKTQSHLFNAMEWVDSSRYWRQLSHLKLKHFESNVSRSVDVDVDHDIADLYATTEIALSLMPVAPYAWYDMALINAMYPETLNNALQALKMSVYVDRVNTNLLKSRVLFLWDNFDRLDDGLRSIFRSQLLLFWQLKRYELVQVLKSKAEIEYFIRDALFDSPDELLVFNRLLLKLNR